MNAAAVEAKPFQIVDLNFVSLYIQDYREAIAYYSQVFGPPDSVDEDGPINGWHMGSTWLTVFPSRDGASPGANPRNAEFAVQVSTAEQVDLLHQALVEAGAKNCMAPRDTSMYEPMRFGCVDDPFGVRIDVYCPQEPRPAARSLASTRPS